jgi:MFS family permease
VEGLAYAARLSPLYIATFFVRLSFGISAVVYFDFMQVGAAGGVSFVVFGFVVAASPLAELLSVSPVGVRIDNAGRKNMLLWGLLLTGLSMGLAPISKSPAWAAGVHAMHGASAAMILVTSLALMGDFAHKESRGREMGIFDAVNLFGWITGFAAGFALVAFLEPRGLLFLAFTIAGVLPVLGFLYGFKTLAEPAERKRAHVSLLTTVRLLTTRRIALLVAPWFALYIVIGAALGFLPEGRNTLNIDPFLFALGVFGVGLGLTLTQGYFGQLSDQHGRGRMMLIGAIGLGGVMAVVGAATVQAVPPGTPSDEAFNHLRDFLAGATPAGPQYAYLALLGIFAICALAFAPAALASLVDHSEDATRGTTMAVYSFVITLGMIIGPIVVGGIYEVFYAIGCMSFVIAMGVLMFLLTVFKLVDERRSAAAGGVPEEKTQEIPAKEAPAQALPETEANGGEDRGG